jgi:hypothetical protein
MTRLTLVLSAVVALALPLRAAAQSMPHADSPKVTMTVTQTLNVGPTVLKPGDYRFQCREINGKTYLVITSIETGKELARVPCVSEMVDTQVANSELRVSVAPTGIRALTSVRIKGEMVAHRVVD